MLTIYPPKSLCRYFLKPLVSRKKGRKKKKLVAEALLSGSGAPPIDCLIQWQEWIILRPGIWTYTEFSQPAKHSVLTGFFFLFKVLSPFSQTFIWMLSNTSLSNLRHRCLKTATPTWQRGFPHFTLMNENESTAAGEGMVLRDESPSPNLPPYHPGGRGQSLNLQFKKEITAPPSRSRGFL